MDKWLVGGGLSAVVGGIALAGYLLFSQSPVGDCSVGQSTFAYTVYGRDMVRSTDIAVLGEGKEVRVTGSPEARNIGAGHAYWGGYSGALLRVGRQRIERRFRA